MFRLFCTGLLALALGCAHTPQADTSPIRSGTPAYSTKVLELVTETLRSSDKKAAPTVVFDLDDTLFDIRSRTLPILLEFAGLQTTRSHFPQAAEKLAKAKLEDMRYDPSDAFRGLGAEGEELIQKWKAFWAERFFSNSYCAKDAMIPGAADYVKRLYGMGANIVYLTGRDEPRMKKGTLESLKKNGLPYGKRVSLILKPRAEADDLDFKQAAFAAIAKQGNVVAAFENEPRNLNAMGDAFPKAILVFIDTQHSKAPDAVTPEAHWVKNYVSDGYSE